MDLTRFRSFLNRAHGVAVELGVPQGNISLDYTTSPHVIVLVDGPTPEGRFLIFGDVDGNSEWGFDLVEPNGVTLVEDPESVLRTRHVRMRTAEALGFYIYAAWKVNKEHGTFELMFG